MGRKPSGKTLEEKKAQRREIDRNYRNGNKREAILEATRKRAHRWYENNRDYARHRQLRWRYGITSEEFDALLAKQNFQCAICFTGEPGKRGWQLDHCHDSNDIRGILCHRCNVGLGHFDDNSIVLKQAIEYLLK